MPSSLNLSRCLFLLILLLLAYPYVGTVLSADGYDSNSPVSVSADRLELDDNTKTLLFSGHAVASQNDVTIYGDRLTVRYQGADREIEKVVAEGNVRIVQGSRTASGGTAVFYRQEGRVVLTGNPKVSQGENFVQGQEITLYLQDSRSIVSGGSEGRVNAVFSPKAEEKP